ncbi:cyclic pyranopterin monophosphate synthase MoaC [uncultured Brachybacterium sp.]|uniref:cyclic pyranopterin monophosphate synthase MoaC n=1 Tax=uncultured Brachybacterium sp. TaxID=189680 RepID=UPI0026390E53|nr:cyclic pyranopterin monophosphate synthase MoaC [uncultured Brachybacterium sp.]
MNDSAVNDSAVNDPAANNTAGDLSHVRADGSAHMVDVTDKAVTSREASARAVLRTRPDVVARIAEGDLPKGEALATARIAGIMGAKRTHELIPLCHPLPLSGVELDLVPRGDRVEITARVRTKGVTGVEMEALTATTVAALTVYDMIKAVDHLATIEGIQVLAKSGGKSGDWTRESAASPGPGEQRGAAGHPEEPARSGVGR